MGMTPVLEVLAKEFRSRRAGRSANATRDIIIPFNDLLKKASSLHGPPRTEALRELEGLTAAGILILEPFKRDPSQIQKVRLPLANAQAFFSHLGTTNPEKERETLSELFRHSSQRTVREPFQDGWVRFCEYYAAMARSGGSVQPFDRADIPQTQAILDSLPRLLSWPGESLMRFASIVLFGESKTLEKLRARIDPCLAKITDNTIQGLADLGITDNERSFLIHGPIRLVFEEGVLDLGLLSRPVRVGISDIRRARLDIGAARCLTVENTAVLHELAKLRSGVLLISSGSEGGFANSAVIDFLRLLPMEIARWHFGDSDPKGFDILRDLRVRTESDIRSLHMNFRPAEGDIPLVDEDLKTLRRLAASAQMTDMEKLEIGRMLEAGSKGQFEQESLGLPRPVWPFY